MVSSYKATGTSLTVDSLKSVWIQKWPGQGSPFTMQICEVSKWVMARGQYYTLIHTRCILSLRRSAFIPHLHEAV